MLYFFEDNGSLRSLLGPKGLGYGIRVLAAANFAKCPQVSLAWEGSYTSLTQWPPSKLSHGQEAGCFSCLFCIQLLFSLFVCTHLFSPNTTKYCFSLRFQLGSGMMCSWHALWGLTRASFLGLPLRGSCAACRISFPHCHKGTSFLIYPKPCLSLGREMLACDCGRGGWIDIF